MTSTVEGVVLAAGYSSRAGLYKMELNFDGKTMLERSIESLYELCSRVIVVGGYKIDQVGELVSKYERAVLLYNEDYHHGMFSSVKRGLAATTAEHILFTDGDYPLINKKTCQVLLNSDGQIVIPVWQGRRGHPILLRRNSIDEILQEPEDSNLKAYIRRKIAAYVQVNDPGILIDVDILGEYYLAIMGKDQQLLEKKCGQ